MSLPEIPVVHDVTNPVGLYEQFSVMSHGMVDACERFYKRPTLRIGDWFSDKWLQKSQPRYSEEIYTIAEKMDRPGILTLNLSYEWACTSAAHDDPDGAGVRHLRALDWPVKGMGDKLVVAKQAGPAGEWYNMTYPGFVGTLNGIAPGRFSASMNIAPIPAHGLTAAGDWIYERVKKWRSNDMPATLLLRQAFEECASFTEAVEMLTNAPLSTPAFYTLAGVQKGEHIVIERNYREAETHSADSCITNCWIGKSWSGGYGREKDPSARITQIRATHKQAKGGFDWLQWPVKNDETVLAFEANPAKGTLALFGAEAGEPVTQVLRLQL